jgi:hypothetical protein
MKPSSFSVFYGVFYDAANSVGWLHVWYTVTRKGCGLTSGAASAFVLRRGDVFCAVHPEALYIAITSGLKDSFGKKDFWS